MTTIGGAGGTRFPQFGVLPGQGNTTADNLYGLDASTSPQVADFLQYLQQNQQNNGWGGSGGFGTNNPNTMNDMYLIAQQSGIIPQNISLDEFGIGSFEQFMNSILSNGFQTSQLSLDTAQRSSQSSLLTSLINNWGTDQALQINEFSNQANIELDLRNLQTRSNYGIFVKQIEQYLLDQMVQERLDNLFFDLDRTSMQNTFSLAKTAVNAARYS
ncbi:MAG: hypothetical protein AAF621_07000 [Pseudomonadota bacterium]